jgi:hypothetical protein
MLKQEGGKAAHGCTGPEGPFFVCGEVGKERLRTHKTELLTQEKVSGYRQRFPRVRGDAAALQRRILALAHAVTG